MEPSLLINAVLSSLSQYRFVIPFVLLVGLLRSPFIKGMIGEWYVNKKLVSGLAAEHYKLFKNVTLPTEDGTTQIDHILLSPFGLFVIETKNMQGWIFGSERQAKWTQQIYKHKSSFQNPLRQNYKHTETLRDLLDLPKAVVYSVVIFTARAEFKTNMPENVGYVSDAIKYISGQQQICFTDQQLTEFAQLLATRKLKPGIRTHVQHVKHVKTIVAAKEQGKDCAVVTTEAIAAEDSSVPAEPICPRCHSLLVSRKNRKTGEAFMGCSSYPKCRYIGH